MILVAENLTVTDPAVARAVAERDPEPLVRLARLARVAGARYLDVNLGPGRRGGGAALEFVLGSLEGVWDRGLLLDSTDPAAMAVAARRWPGELVLNGYCGDPGREKVLEVAAEFGLEVVVFLMAGGVPRGADERLALAVDLAGRCAARGVGLGRLWIDPVVAPVGWDGGQEYGAALLEVLRRLPEVFGQPLRSIVGLSNLTTGAAGARRVPWLQEVYLAAAWGAGLTHAMVDVRNAQVLRVARALGALGGERVYAPEELA